MYMYKKYFKNNKKYLQKGGTYYNIEIIANYNKKLKVIFNQSIECDDMYTLSEFCNINLQLEYKFILNIHNTLLPYHKYELNTQFNEIKKTEDNKIRLYIRFSDRIELRFRTLTDSQIIELDYEEYMALSFKNIKRTKLTQIFNNKYNFFMYNDKICLPNVTVSMLEITDFNNIIDISILVITDSNKRSIIDRLIHEYELQIKPDIYDDPILRDQLDLYCTVKCSYRVGLYWYYVLLSRSDYIINYYNHISMLEFSARIYRTYIDEYELLLEADTANGVQNVQHLTTYNRNRELYLSFQNKLDIFIKYYNELLLLVVNHGYIPDKKLITMVHSYFPDKVIYYLKQFLFSINEYLLCITPKYFDLNKFKIFNSIEQYDDFMKNILESEENYNDIPINPSIYSQLYGSKVKFFSKNIYSEYILDDFQNRNSEFIQNYLIKYPNFMRYLSTSHIHAFKDIIIKYLSDRNYDYIIFVPYKFGKWYPEELISIIEEKMYKVRESDDSIVVNFIKKNFENFSVDYQRM